MPYNTGFDSGGLIQPGGGGFGEWPDKWQVTAPGGSGTFIPTGDPQTQMDVPGNLPTTPLQIPTTGFQGWQTGMGTTTTPPPQITPPDRLQINRDWNQSWNVPTGETQPTATTDQPTPYTGGQTPGTGGMPTFGEFTAFDQIVPVTAEGITPEEQAGQRMGENLIQRAQDIFSTITSAGMREARQQAGLRGAPGSGMENALVMTALGMGQNEMGKMMQGVTDVMQNFYMQGIQNAPARAAYWDTQATMAWDLAPTADNPNGGFVSWVNSRNQSRVATGGKPMTEQEVKASWVEYNKHHQELGDILTDVSEIWEPSLVGMVGGQSFDEVFDPSGASNIAVYDDSGNQTGTLTYGQYRDYLGAFNTWENFETSDYSTMPRPPWMTPDMFEEYATGEITLNDGTGDGTGTGDTGTGDTGATVADTGGDLSDTGATAGLILPSATPGVEDPTAATTVTYSRGDTGTVDVSGRQVSGGQISGTQTLKSATDMPSSNYQEFMTNKKPGETILEYARRVHPNDPTWWE